MKANELRIGNWLKRLDDSFFQIQASDILNLSSWKAEYLKPNPIPLTEEILLKCGFEKWVLKINDVEEVQLGYYRHKKLFNECVFYLPYFNFNLHIGSINIKYLHQLQNLYFALTGEELVINL